MRLSEWKLLREKAKNNQLEEEDIQRLVSDNIIELPADINYDKQPENNLEEKTEENNSGAEHSYQKVFRNPSVPPLYTNDDFREKAGFSNVLLLAIISFISEILFIGIAFFIYK